MDPERDTPEIMQAYLASFDSSFVALRGSEEQTKAVAKEFKVFYAKVPGKTEGTYTMDHTAGVFLFHPDGRFASIIDFHEDRRFAVPKIRRTLS